MFKIRGTNAKSVTEHINVTVKVAVKTVNKSVVKPAVKQLLSIGMAIIKVGLGQGRNWTYLKLLRQRKVFLKKNFKAAVVEKLI